MIQPRWDGARDVMSVSFCRTPRGIHLFFLARPPVATAEEEGYGPSRVYQIISQDEGESWSAPQLISTLEGFNCLNNAGVIRRSRGRLLAPVSYVPGAIFELYNQQEVYVLYSDDDGGSWMMSNRLALNGASLMEPGVAACADGSGMISRSRNQTIMDARGAR